MCRVNCDELKKFDTAAVDTAAVVGRESWSDEDLEDSEKSLIGKKDCGSPTSDLGISPELADIESSFSMGDSTFEDNIIECSSECGNNSSQNLGENFVANIMDGIVEGVCSYKDGINSSSLEMENSSTSTEQVQSTG